MPTIKLSKKQWEEIGKKTGWIKLAFGQQFLNSQEDVQWLKDTHLKGKTWELFNSFVLEGNEDSPTKIETFREQNPNYKDKPNNVFVYDEETNGLIPLHKAIEFGNSKSQDVDENTLLVGKVHSLGDAKKMCQEKFGKIPRVGYEIKIDEGETTIKERALGAGGMMTNQQYKYKTYLQNNAGQFRVWTWIDVSPIMH